VIAVFNQQVGIEPTLAGALSDVLGSSVSVGPKGGTTPPTTGSGQSAQTYLKAASNDYAAAQTALTAGNLGQYQADVKAMDKQLLLAQSALAKK
jgi:uncharacterized membrane protein (UPF0182 family)